MASRIALSLLLFAAALLPACDDKSKPKPDAGMGDGGMCVAGTAGPLEMCTTNESCMSCLCQSFGHSKLCTKACTVAADCPTPFSGCANGFCQR
ncbi:MAG TPA: hypothetical protein VNO30_49070 [Kofleriaceae bacterium]|nr:hypothetical protein [Kofleriaceae bacterium]